MKVVFKKTGQIKNVPDGYARNYLLPRGIAEIATDEAVSVVQKQQEQHTLLAQAQEEQWKNAVAQLQQKPLQIQRAANTSGVLFGALGAKDIVEEAKKQGVSIAPDWFSDIHIKEIGNHTVNLVLPNKKMYTIFLEVSAA